MMGLSTQDDVVNGSNKSVSLGEQVEGLEGRVRFLSDQNEALARENETLRARNDNQKNLIERLKRPRVDAQTCDNDSLHERIRNQSAELTLLLRSKESLKQDVINLRVRNDELAQDLREGNKRIYAIGEYVRNKALRCPDVKRIESILNGD